MTITDAINLAAQAHVPPISKRRPASPICGRCGAAKTAYPRGRGREWVCNECRKAARIAEALQADGPPLCARCGEPKSKQRSSSSHKGFRWFCYPCHEQRRKDSKAISEANPVVIPPRQEVTAKPKRQRPRHWADVREYRACERRWQEPVTCPSRAIRTYACGG
jgi:hypothetical protein